MRVQAACVLCAYHCSPTQHAGYTCPTRGGLCDIMLGDAHGCPCQCRHGMLPQGVIKCMHGSGSAVPQARSPHHMQLKIDLKLCMPSAKPSTFQMYAILSPPPEAAISGCAGFHATANTASAQATSLMTGSETVQRLASRA
ncbi:TPA: hypothetical protein ACH3X1_015428 [Trebouxia sp. C0004]